MRDPIYELLHNMPEIETSPLHPLELRVPKAGLLRSVQDSLKLLRDQLPSVEHDPNVTAYANAMIQQRVDFLETLNGIQGPTVYVGLYPIDTNEFHEVTDLQNLTYEDPEDDPWSS